jgi:hypothetical protein
MTKRSDRKDTEVSDKPRDWLSWIFWFLFIVIVPLTALWMAKKPVPQVALPVPVHDIPAYHLITTSDLTTKTLDTALVSSDVLDEETTIVNHYAIETLTAGNLIRKDQVQPISDLQSITNTVVIGIPATQAMVLGGNLRASDVVDVIFAPAPSDAQPAPEPTLFENLLVLDVKSVPIEKAADSSQRHEPYVVVVALPVDRRDEFVAHSAAGTMLLTRHNAP